MTDGQARLTARRRATCAALLAGITLSVGLGAGAAEAKPSRAELRDQINKQSAALKAITEDYDKATEDLKKSQETIRAINKRLPALSSQMLTAQAQVAKVAASEYKGGGLTGFTAMIDGGQRDTMVARLSAMDRMAHQRQQWVGGLSKAQLRYVEQKQVLATTAARQLSQLRDLSARKKKIKKDLDHFYAVRREVYGADDEAGGGYTGPIPEISGKAGIAVKFAYNAIGTPYVFAADGPKGYDCSGIVLAAWRAAGKSLPHNAAMQYNAVAHIKRSELAPGDLVFYSNLGHVGIFVGDNKVIHAPTFGERVKISSVDMMPPYGFGRVR